jgi:tetratricopeptide (TPR) repeat protein
VNAVYSARDVARIVGLQESRVRYWAQTGFVGPSERRGGRAMYSFQDLIGVKAAKELLDRGLSVQRVRKTLDTLRASLPSVDRPLQRLRVLSDGDRLVVADENGAFEPLSGQLVMDFDLGALEGRVAEVMELSPREPEPNEPAPTAYERFLEGVRLDGDPATEDAALAAYRQALALDPHFAAAHTNCGNLSHRLGRLDDARASYEAALAIDPEQPEARYNLGNLYEELGEHGRAVAEWYRVVSACPEFADAHFNLACAASRDGARDRARAHLERYLALDTGEGGKWVERARALLRSLE